LIELQGVSKRFGDVIALHPGSLRFEPEQTTVLLGLSGCGKSTVLRLIAGLVRPDTGEIYVDGQRLSAETLPGIRHRTGYVIQEGGLFPHLSARANVELMSRHLGRSAEEREARIRELAELTRLPLALLARYPGQLSGGQRQRVSLMRALMLDPPVLLLDEPLGALDPITRAELQSDLREIFRTLRKTVLLVTHDVREAAFFGDRLLLLREGRVVQEGVFEEFLTAPSEPFVTRFIEAQRADIPAAEAVV